MKTYLSILISLILVPAYSQVSTQVYTPKGSLVQDTYINNEQLTSYDVAYLAQRVATEYPQAIILNNATSTYNCHAYAWHMTEGGKTVWMGWNTNPTSIYWRDGSYVETTSIKYGLKVSYGYVNHSAVTTAENDVFISKWGNWPLVKHRKDYGPYPSTDLKYYEKTASINLLISGPASLHKPGLSGTYTASPPSPNIEWWLRKDNGNLDGAIRVATGSKLILQCVKAGSILPLALDNETLLNENDNIYEPQSNIEDQIYYFLYARHGNVTSSTIRIQAGGELRAITPYLLNAKTKLHCLSQPCLRHPTY